MTALLRACFQNGGQGVTVHITHARAKIRHGHTVDAAGKRVGVSCPIDDAEIPAVPPAQGIRASAYPGLRVCDMYTPP